MSTVIEPVPARFRRASATITSHTIVDFFSFVVISLMPLLAARLDLSKPEKAMVIGLGAVASGLIQPLVAVLSDRHNTRILGTLGMLVAVVAVSCIGLVQNYWQLLLVQAVAASGIGAFHPVAAAAIGSLAGKQRTRFVATFFLAGMVGGVLGNVLAPQYVGFMSQAAGEHNVARGLRSLLWLMIPGALGVVMLSWAIHGVSHRAHDAIENHARLSAAERAARWRAVILLYVGNVIRFCTNMALVYLIVEWTTQLAAERHAGESVDRLGMIASEINGPMQAAQQVGMGFGGITLGMVLSARYEKAAFLVFPLIGAGAITLIPEVESLPESWVLPVAFVITALAGIGFGSVVPVSIAAAQRLLPHRTSLASGLMMGGAWALAFLGPHFAGLIHTHVGLRAAFLATAALLASAGVLALALPGRLMRQTSDE
ncbi:MAG: MFS transporter [Planctomycetota bacterium]|nr:MAG: MFS transporter [Planctomycetota bacterium]